MGDIIKKQFTNFVGLDLKSSNINRDDRAASDMRNAQYQKDGDIEKRKGYRGKGGSQGGFGIYDYNRINPTTGVIEPELLTVGSSVSKAVDATLTITYGGADPTALASFFFDVDTDQYRLQILEGTAIVLDQGVGKGIDDASPYSVAALDAAVNAVVNFSSTTTGDTSAAAAFLDIVRDHDLVVSDVTISGTTWTSVNTPLPDPLIGSENNKTASDFENVSAVQLKNIMYFANGYDEILKYDGQNLYRAGVPIPNAGPSTALAAGGLTGTYRHIYRYVQKDAVGNLVEGSPSADSSPDLSPSGQSIDVTVDNITASTGFNTNCAIVAGAQVGVNVITVDDGSGGSHTMLVGDTAYFFDGVSSAYVERLVTGITGTTITVDGAAVDVDDNAVISNNLRIQVFRNENGGLFKFLSAEIPNNSFAATQLYNDDVADASLGIQFIQPFVDRGLPPKGKYLASFNSQLVIGGQIGKEDQINWSDIENPEYFPIGNNLRSETDGNEKVTGIAQNNESFAIFKERSIDIVSGEIETNTLRREVLTKDLGCVAHATITEVAGRLFFLSDRGVFSVTSGQLPREESALIEPVFKQEGIQDAFLYKTKRAVAVNHRQDQKYILYLPTEKAVAGPDVNSTDNSVLFAYDYYRESWMKWDNMNMAGGAIVFNKKLYWVERRLSSVSNLVEHYLYQQMATNDAYDYMDHDSPVEFEYFFNWFHFNEPSVYKSYIRINVFALTTTLNNTFDLNIRGEADFSNGNEVFNFPLDLSGSASGYGNGSYGLDPYGDSASQSAKHKLNRKARALRIILENCVSQENVNITGFDLDMAAPYRAEIRE